jgi:hypothetical protein
VRGLVVPDDAGGEVGGEVGERHDDACGPLRRLGASVTSGGPGTTTAA